MLTCAVRISFGLFLFSPQADPHGRQPDQRAEFDAHLLRVTVGGRDRDRCQLAGLAGQFDLYCSWRDYTCALEVDRAAS